MQAAVATQFTPPQVEMLYVIMQRVGNTPARPSPYLAPCTSLAVARQLLHMVAAYREKAGDTVRYDNHYEPRAFVAEQGGVFVASYAIQKAK